jgi:bifunctional oligoribonuclease and PAP phosphatase NrnA
MIEQLETLKSLLNSPKDIVITSHRNPDGDAIGSSLGLYHYLKLKGHQVKIVFPSEYPVIFEWMPDAQEITIFDLVASDATQILTKASIHFALDYNAYDRIDKLGEILMVQKHQTTVMIDHHLFPEPIADYTLSDTSASSTSELVLDFIEMMGDTKMMNKTIASCLYTGIVTDTGSFKYATSSKLFRTVAMILDHGVDDTAIQNLINNSLTEKNLRLLGHCIHNRMEILDEFRTGIIYLLKQDYEKYNIQRGDTEGIVNYLLLLKNIKLACFITEQPNIVKLSLRSKGDFDVQTICRENFKGGGHKNASGGFSHAHIRATIDKLKSILPAYKDELLKDELISF